MPELLAAPGKPYTNAIRRVLRVLHLEWWREFAADRHQVHENPRFREAFSRLCCHPQERFIQIGDLGVSGPI